MSTYFSGRIVVFNASNFKHESFGEYDCFQFKELDENLMEEYLNRNDNEKWNTIISKLYNLKLGSDSEETKRITEHLLNNAYILSKSDLRNLREHYEEEKQKIEESIERLDETMRNQQSLTSYQEFEGELSNLNEDLSEVNSKCWALKNFEDMFNVIENCYEKEEFKGPCDILEAYLIIVRMQ